MLNYDFWLWYYIGLIAQALTAAILIIIVPMFLFFLILDIIKNMKAKNKDWIGLYKKYWRLIWIYTVMFFACHGVYAFFTGSARLHFIGNILANF